MRYGHKERGSPMLRGIYARWIQLLAAGDLLGRDGRPSQSKLASFATLTVTLWCAFWQVTGPGLFALLRRPDGTPAIAGSIGAATGGLILAALCASFGRHMLDRYLSRTSVNLSASQQDTHVETHAVTEVLERRVGSKDGGSFEPSP